MGTGQVLKSTALRADTVQEIDPDRPTSVAEITADGEAHIELDLGPVFGALASANPAAADAIDSARVEIWKTGTQFFVDATGFQPIADLNPSNDFGPFAPGLGVIDLARLGDLGEDDLVALLVGNGIPDPVELAASLPTTLDSVTQDPADQSVYTATASYADIVAAIGGDVETIAKGLAVSLSKALEMDVQELVAFYTRVFGEFQSDVVITIGDDGALSSLRITTDLSSVYEKVFDPDTGLDFGQGDAEVAVARRMFADTTWILESLVTFALDDSITVEPPIGDFEDRTDSAIEYYASVTSG
jgi:hypothetical protein